MSWNENWRDQLRDTKESPQVKQEQAQPQDNNLREEEARMIILKQLNRLTEMERSPDKTSTNIIISLAGLIIGIVLCVGIAIPMTNNLISQYPDMGETQKTVLNVAGVLVAMVPLILVAHIFGLLGGD